MRANNEMSTRRVSPAIGGAFPAPVLDEDPRAFAARATALAPMGPGAAISPPTSALAAELELDPEAVWMRASTAGSTAPARSQHRRRTASAATAGASV